MPNDDVTPHLHEKKPVHGKPSQSAGHSVNADPAKGDAAKSAAVAGAAHGEVGSAQEDAFDYVLRNDDCVNMARSVTSAERMEVGRAQIVLNEAGEEVDSLGCWVDTKASDSVRALTHAVHEGASPERIEAACVVASEKLHRLESEHLHTGDPSPSSDLMQVRQAMCSIAAHPNASDRAVRQAIRAEGKYAARPVLRNSSDSEMIQFALDNSDTNAWHGISEDGAVNPAMPTSGIDQITNALCFIDGADDSYGKRLLSSLRDHPNLTDELRARLSAK